MSSGEAAGTVFQIGSIHIAHSIVVTWGIMLTLALFSWAVTTVNPQRTPPIQKEGGTNIG